MLQIRQKVLARAASCLVPEIDRSNSPIRNVPNPLQIGGRHIKVTDEAANVFKLRQKPLEISRRGLLDSKHVEQINEAPAALAVEEQAALRRNRQNQTIISRQPLSIEQRARLWGLPG